ncbi:MAG: ClpXP protease specificity-enhancing factor [Gammaproteobacteria bacterium]|nr:ClpXP protease specificity-enhancing factor [Gammaproteobacteria bacterium]
MTSNKPYLIRALYEWLVDNDATPHIMVNSRHPQVEIPPGIEKDGQVVLNIANRAVRGLQILNDHIQFSARFNGVPHDIFIPIEAVMAIYSLEDGEGMMFAEDNSGAESTEAQSEDADAQSAQKRNRPGLKIVK